MKMIPATAGSARKETFVRPATARIRRTATLLAAASMLFLGMFTAAPAKAATVTPSVLGNCGNMYYPGDRICLIAWGGPSAPRIQFVALHVYTASDGHDHAYAEGYVAKWSDVYLDVSHDGGRTWVGWVNAGMQTWAPWSADGTADVYDGPGTWVRACAYGWDNHYVCTGWN
jgi:hypothetical protein